MNFLQLQSRLITKLAESATPQFWSLAEIQYNLNQAYREFLIATEFRTRVIPLTPVAVGYYDIPAGLMVPKTLYYDGIPVNQTSREFLDNLTATYRGAKLGLVGDGNTGVIESPRVWLFEEGYIRVYPAPANETTPAYAQQESGTAVGGDTVLPLTGDWSLLADKSLLFIGGILQSPTSWFFSGATIVLDTPLPGAAEWTLAGLSAAGTPSNTVTLRYVPKPNDLAVNADTPSWIPEAYHDALIDRAAAECFSRDGDGQNLAKTAFYMQKYNAAVSAFKAAFFREVVADFALPFKV